MSGAVGTIGQVDVGLNKEFRDIDSNRLSQFARILHPESSGEGRAAFIKSITDIKDPNLRAQTIGKLWASLEPEKQAAIDINGLVNSADNVSDPVFQAGQAREIAAKEALVNKLFTPDPASKGTPAEWGTGAGQLVANTALTFLPGILRVNAFGAQVYGSTLDRIKAEHPELTDDQLHTWTGASTLAQLAPQEALMAASHGLMEPLLKWAGAAANPVVRFGIGGGVHLATGAAGGAVGQVGENIAEKKPDIFQGVGEAATSGMVQALPFAIHGGLHAGLTPRVESEPAAGSTPGVAPEAQPPSLPEATHPGTAADVLGPHPTDETAQAAQPEVLQTVAKNLFPDLTADQARNIADRASLLSVSNLETDRFRYELEKFLPQDTVTNFGPTNRLLQAYARFRDGPSTLTAKEISVAERAYNEAREYQAPAEIPFEFRHPGEPPPVAPPTAERFVPPTRGGPQESPAPGVARPAPPQDLASAIQQQRALAARASAEAALSGTTAAAPRAAATFPTPAHTAVYRDLVARGMDETQARNLVSKARGATPADILTDVQTQMRGGPPPPPHGNISGEEPWVQREANRTLSRGVANRYLAERVTGGELEPINPEIGASTEELMARGLKMNPDQVDRHINDLMENAGGNARDQAAAVRKKEQYLTQRSRHLSLKAETTGSTQDRANYEAARKELNDFHGPGGPVKKMKELFHSHGVGLQGEPSPTCPPMAVWRKNTSRKLKREFPQPPKFRPRLEKVAKRVRDTHTQEYKARADLEREANRPSKRKIPDADKVVEDIHKAMNGFPCPM